MNTSSVEQKKNRPLLMQVEGLKKRYGKTEVLKGLDFYLEPGEICGFIGPNGAGKSTTIRSILGLIAPNGGRIELLGTPVDFIDHRHRRQIGYMPGDPAFPETMKVKEVLNLSASLYKKHCGPRQQELLERLQLDPNKKVRDLSLGNKKKLAVITALQHDPELLILDEPTSGLDPLMQREFFALLQEYAHRGCGIVLSSHNLWEVEAYCTRMVCIQDGRILWNTTREDFQKNKAWKIMLKVPAGRHPDQPGAVLIESGDGLRRQDGDVLEALEKLEGVSSYQRCRVPGAAKADKDEKGPSLEEVTFLYQGDWPRLLVLLEQLELQDLSIGKPDLEEQMMEWYAYPHASLGRGPVAAFHSLSQELPANGPAKGDRV